MAERPNVEDVAVVVGASTVTADGEVENLGNFAHRLSLDVTSDAITAASHNGTIADQAATNSQSDVADDGVSQSLPNTPATASTSFEDCSVARKRRNPVGRIRDASRTFVKWLRFKSKSINHLNDSRGVENVDPTWKPWRKSCKGHRAEPVSKRALPPVPVAGAEARQPVVDGHEEDFEEPEMHQG